MPIERSCGGGAGGEAAPPVAACTGPMNATKHTSLAAGLALLMLLGLAVYAAARGAKAQPARQGMLVISGRLTAPLWPGKTLPADPWITNRYPFGLRITRLRVRVSVDAQHRAAGCSVPRDFRVWQVPRREYPIRVRARASVPLSRLGVDAVPHVEMRDLPIDQVACQGARMRLRYSAQAVRDTPGAMEVVR